MNKFETTLLQTLSSIDESLKAIASGKPAAPQKPTPSRKAVEKTSKVPAKLAKAAKPAKPAKPQGKSKDLKAPAS